MSTYGIGDIATVLVDGRPITGIVYYVSLNGWLAVQSPAGRYAGGPVAPRVRRRGPVTFEFHSPHRRSGPVQRAYVRPHTSPVVYIGRHVFYVTRAELAAEIVKWRADARYTVTRHLGIG